jgi:hypothetical protein
LAGLRAGFFGRSEAGFEISASTWFVVARLFRRAGLAEGGASDADAGSRVFLLDVAFGSVFGWAAASARPEEAGA